MDLMTAAYYNLPYFIRPLVPRVSRGDEADDQQQAGMPGAGGGYHKSSMSL